MIVQYHEFMKKDSKLMPEIYVPPEMAYTMQYMMVVANSGMGKNAQCETRAQALFPMEDLIINMSMADFCYPLKSSLLVFLEHIYLDVEKEIGEDFLNQVWQLIALLKEDVKRFVEVMQRQKRGATGARKGRAAPNDETVANSEQDVLDQPDIVEKNGVDVNMNFSFVTNFGSFKVSELMQTYVFEGVFPTLQQFFSLRVPVKQPHRQLIRMLLKLCVKSMAYKSKPSHEKRISRFVQEVQNFEQLCMIGLEDKPPIDFASMPVSNQEDGGKKKLENAVDLSPAQKVKVFMHIAKSDADIKKKIRKEFEELVLSILNIKTRTDEAFQGANTIRGDLFIESLIKSSDV